ncbi:hypothetical protein SBADM41S_04435 [Streptomyces badius]
MRIEPRCEWPEREIDRSAREWDLARGRSEDSARGSVSGFGARRWLTPWRASPKW